MPPLKPSLAAPAAREVALPQCSAAVYVVVDSEEGVYSLLNWVRTQPLCSPNMDAVGRQDGDFAALRNESCPPCHRSSVTGTVEVLGEIFKRTAAGTRRMRAGAEDRPYWQRLLQPPSKLS